MRKFAIYNSVGDSYELNNVKNFFHNPSGLGFVRTAEYIKIGNIYEIVQDNFEQPAPSGQICFKDEKTSPAYSKYAEFVRFLQKLPLTLVYRSDKNHKIDVAPEVIEKTEISRPLGLNITISFKALSLWYDEIEEQGTSSVKILSDSTKGCACHIEITGALTSPTWIQTLNGVQIATGQVNTNIGAGETLHIRSDTNPYQIYKESNGTKTDLYALSNFSTKRFITLEEGENVISCSGAESIKVKARLSYETV